MFKKFAAAAVAVSILGWAGTVAAAPLGIYVFDGTYHSYQNTANNPCVFYGPGNCPADPAAWPDPASPTNGAFAPLSQVYSGADYTIWTGVVGGSFVFGLDINDTEAAQTLAAFTIGFYNGTTLLESYALSAGSGSMLVPGTSNGIGWADYILAAGCDSGTTGNTGLNLCASGLYTPFLTPAGTTSVEFGFSYGTSGNDGPDKVFVVPGQTPPEPPPTVPEPASMVLLGTGLVGVATALRRRWRS